MRSGSNRIWFCITMRQCHIPHGEISNHRKKSIHVRNPTRLGQRYQKNIVFCMRKQHHPWYLDPYPDDWVRAVGGVAFYEIKFEIMRIRSGVARARNSTQCSPRMHWDNQGQICEQTWWWNCLGNSIILVTPTT